MEQFLQRTCNAVTCCFHFLLSRKKNHKAEQERHNSTKDTFQLSHEPVVSKLSISYLDAQFKQQQKGGFTQITRTKYASSRDRQFWFSKQNSRSWFKQQPVSPRSFFIIIHLILGFFSISSSFSLLYCRCPHTYTSFLKAKWLFPKILRVSCSRRSSLGVLN